MPCYNVWLFPLVKVEPVNSSKTSIIGRTILSIIGKKLYNTPPPYFIIIARSVTTMEAIEFHRNTIVIIKFVLHRKIMTVHL